jgi:two-component system chemotaxis response regulator CheB
MVIKVLIVDDSAVVRHTYKALLESDSEIVVIGTASDPYIAAQIIQREKPDVIMLDNEISGTDGLTFLKKIMTQKPIPVVVISNQTQKGADVAIKALEAGAVDLMAKPNLSSAFDVNESRISLIDKVRSAYSAKKISMGAKIAQQERQVQPKNTIVHNGSTRFSHQALIAVGASTGGTDAIRTFLEALPAQMPPILIVQHMPEKFTASFAKRLNDECALNVNEAEDGELITAGTVYIAPGGQHMAIQNRQGKTVIRIFHDELVNRHRPSVNVLFNSVAETRGNHATGIILTGMGDDGATGMLAMHQRGAYTIAQDEATSVVFGMPCKAVLAGGVSKILPLNEIAVEVCSRLNVLSGQAL